MAGLKTNLVPLAFAIVSLEQVLVERDAILPVNEPVEFVDIISISHPMKQTTATLPSKKKKKKKIHPSIHSEQN